MMSHRFGGTQQRQRCDTLSRLGVPELERLVIACRDHPGAVGAEGTGQDRAGVALEGAKLPARLGVPEL